MVKDLLGGELEDKFIHQQRRLIAGLRGLDQKPDLSVLFYGFGTVAEKACEDIIATYPEFYRDISKVFLYSTPSSKSQLEVRAKKLGDMVSSFKKKIQPIKDPSGETLLNFIECRGYIETTEKHTLESLIDKEVSTIFFCADANKTYKHKLDEYKKWAEKNSKKVAALDRKLLCIGNLELIDEFVGHLPKNYDGNIVIVSNCPEILAYQMYLKAIKSGNGLDPVRITCLTADESRINGLLNKKIQARTNYAKFEELCRKFHISLDELGWLGGHHDDPLLVMDVPENAIGELCEIFGISNKEDYKRFIEKCSEELRMSPIDMTKEVPGVTTSPTGTELKRVLKALAHGYYIFNAGVLTPLGIREDELSDKEHEWLFAHRPVLYLDERLCFRKEWEEANKKYENRLYKILCGDVLIHGSTYIREEHIKKLRELADLIQSFKHGPVVKGIPLQKGDASWLFKDYPVEGIQVDGNLLDENEFKKYSAKIFGNDEWKLFDVKFKKCVIDAKITNETLKHAGHKQVLRDYGLLPEENGFYAEREHEVLPKLLLRDLSTPVIKIFDPNTSQSIELRDGKERYDLWKIFSLENRVLALTEESSRGFVLRAWDTSPEGAKRAVSKRVCGNVEMCLGLGKEDHFYLGIDKVLLELNGSDMEKDVNQKGFDFRITSIGCDQDTVYLGTDRGEIRPVDIRSMERKGKGYVTCRNKMIADIQVLSSTHTYIIARDSENLYVWEKDKYSKPIEVTVGSGKIEADIADDGTLKLYLYSNESIYRKDAQGEKQEEAIADCGKINDFKKWGNHIFTCAGTVVGDVDIKQKHIMRFPTENTYHLEQIEVSK